jgi:ABC-type spermidine/putrescine transport system permease subunit II
MDGHAGDAQGADIDPGDGRRESSDQRADRNWSEILQELRVSQTGTQIISGFLLTLAFQQRFRELDFYQDVVYGILVALAASSTALGLAAVSLHRARFHQHDKPRLVTIASRLLVAIIWIVAVLSSGVVLLIFDVVFGHLAGVIGGVVTAIGFVVLLMLLPRSVMQRSGRSTGSHST